MTTLRRTIKIGTDENNAAENLRKIQIGKNIKTSSTTIETTKRSALGELGNRAAIHLKGKDGQLKDSLKETKHANLRNEAKPRVDTYWKKNTVLGGGTKKLVRSDSMRSINLIGSTTGTTTAAVHLKRATSVKSIVDLVSATSSKPVITTKPTVTVKPMIRAATKVIPTKSLIPAINKSKDENNSLSLRREDSNLSRRSITKLRAALSNKDVNKKDSGNVVTINNKIQEKPIVNVTSTTNNNKIAVVGESTRNQIQRVKIKESEIISHSVQMLNLIENIDINDGESLIMVPEYVNDIYSYLYNLEILFPIEFEYLKDQSEVTPRMRSVLLDWVNEVAHQFHLIPETYQMTVGIIDRYLQVVPTTTRRNLQLVGVTAIFIAAKYEELYPSDIGDFVYITDNTYSKTQILEMEKKIVKALDFQLCRPIPIIFLRRFSKAANAEADQYLCSKYILELISIEYSMAHYKPSEIAASALCLSMQLFNKNNKSNDKLWTPTLKFYSRYNMEHLMPIVKKIAKIIFEAPQAKQKTVYKKFESSKYEKISTKSELYGPVIQKIISSD